MTCDKCGMDMDRMPPGDPPKWLQAWACWPCGWRVVQALPYIEEIDMIITTEPPKDG